MDKKCVYCAISDDCPRHPSADEGLIDPASLIKEARALAAVDDATMRNALDPRGILRELATAIETLLAERMRLIEKVNRYSDERDRYREQAHNSNGLEHLFAAAERDLAAMTALRDERQRLYEVYKDKARKMERERDKALEDAEVWRARFERQLQIERGER
jgi:hypothetical protein